MMPGGKKAHQGVEDCKECIEAKNVEGMKRRIQNVNGK